MRAALAQEELEEGEGSREGGREVRVGCVNTGGLEGAFSASLLLASCLVGFLVTLVRMAFQHLLLTETDSLWEPPVWCFRQ